MRRSQVPPKKQQALVVLSTHCCVLPLFARAQANAIRTSVLDQLWGEVAGQEDAEDTLIAACNLHSEAWWWIKHRECAATCIQKLCQLKMRASQRATLHP